MANKIKYVETDDYFPKEIMDQLRKDTEKKPAAKKPTTKSNGKKNK